MNGRYVMGGCGKYGHYFAMETEVNSEKERAELDKILRKKWRFNDFETPDEMLKRLEEVTKHRFTPFKPDYVISAVGQVYPHGSSVYDWKKDS